RTVQRLLRVERSHRSAGAFRGAACLAGKGRRRGATARRGLHRGARNRAAADGGPRGGYRSPRHVAHGFRVHPRGDHLPAIAYNRVIMRFESFVALRYLRGKRKNRFISLITLISVAGVAVGVMTLIIVIGVMTGFNIALRETIIGNRAHLSVYDPLDREIPDYEALIEEIRRVVPEVEAAGPFIQFQGLINNAGTGRRISSDSMGAFFMGVEPTIEEQVTSLAKNLTTAEGRLHG